MQALGFSQRLSANTQAEALRSTACRPQARAAVVVRPRAAASGTRGLRGYKERATAPKNDADRGAKQHAQMLSRRAAAKQQAAYLLFAC